MVKCSECGFLAVRNSESRNLEEIEFKSRETGNIGKQRYVLVPVCFGMIINIDREIEELRKSPQYTIKQNEIGEVIWPKWNELVKIVIDKDRECTHFTKWYQGFTPKEHREMLDRQWQIATEEKRRINDRKWHIAEIILIVILSGLFTLLGAFISKGS